MNTPDRELRLKEVPIIPTHEATWPRGIRSIGINELDGIGVDNDGHLYWHGKLVYTRRGIELTFWQSAIALAVAVATVAQALVSWLQYLHPAS